MGWVFFEKKYVSGNKKPSILGVLSLYFLAVSSDKAYFKKSLEEHIRFSSRILEIS